MAAISPTASERLAALAKCERNVDRFRGRHLMDGAKPCIGHRFRVHSALMNATRVLIVAYRRRRAPLVAMSLLTMLLAVQGCAVDWTREHRLYCRMDERLLVRDTLYFGLSIPGGGEVSEADWRHFESDDLTRAFPKGFTVLDARRLARSERRYRP